jgi:hypothetical protein
VTAVGPVVYNGDPYQLPSFTLSQVSPTAVLAVVGPLQNVDYTLGGVIEPGEVIVPKGGGFTPVTHSSTALPYPTSTIVPSGNPLGSFSFVITITSSSTFTYSTNGGVTTSGNQTIPAGQFPASGSVQATDGVGPTGVILNFSAGSGWANGDVYAFSAQSSVATGVGMIAVTPTQISAESLSADAALALIRPAWIAAIGANWLAQNPGAAVPLALLLFPPMKFDTAAQAVLGLWATAGVSQSAAPPTDFGTDLLCLNDLDPRFATVSGVANLKQALLHRLQTPRGTLFYDSPDGSTYGIDLRDYLSSQQTPSLARQMQSDVQAEVMKDQRVQSCQVQVTTPTPGAYKVTIAGLASGGPFSMVLAVNNLTVTQLG